MAGRRGISWLEVIMVKVLLLGTAFGVRGVVRDATSATLSRANAAILDVGPDHEGSEVDPGGGLPSRAILIGLIRSEFPRNSRPRSHPQAVDPEVFSVFRARMPYCETH